MTNLSFVTYTGDGGNDTFAITMNYLEESHIKASIDGIVTTSFSIVGSDAVFTSAPALDAVVKLYRDTPRTLAGRLVDFTSSSVLSESDLDTSSIQLLYIAQEAYERGGESGLVYLTYSSSLAAYDADTNKIVQVTDPTSAQDAATKNYVDTTAMILNGGNFDANSVRVISVAEPLQATDAANKQYVDDIATWGTAGQGQAIEITTVGGTNTYTLTGMEYVEKNMLIVSLNGDIQAPTTDFTVTSASPNSSITLIGTVTGGQPLVVLNFGKKRFIPASAVDDDSIATAKLQDDAVTAAKLAPSAVVTDSIVDGSVTLAKMADDSVGTDELVDDSVTNAKLAEDAVDTAQIADNAIDWDRIKETAFYVHGGGTPVADYVIKIDKTTGNASLGVLTFSDISNIVSYPATIPINNLKEAAADVQIGTSSTNPRWKVTNVATPTNDYDVATKKYVDDSSGTPYKGGRLISHVTLGAPAASLEATPLYNVGEYNHYKIVFQGVTFSSSATGNYLRLLTRDEANGVYDGFYSGRLEQKVGNAASSASDITEGYSLDTSGIMLFKETTITGPGTSIGLSGEIKLRKTILAANTLWCGDFITTQYNHETRGSFSVGGTIVSGLDAVKLVHDAGNIATGEIFVYGFEG